MGRIGKTALLLLVIVTEAWVIWGLSGCVTIDRVQVGPDHWPRATTQPTSAEIEKKIWADFE